MTLSQKAHACVWYAADACTEAVSVPLCCVAQSIAECVQPLPVVLRLVTLVVPLAML